MLDICFVVVSYAHMFHAHHLLDYNNPSFVRPIPWKTTFLRDHFSHTFIYNKKKLPLVKDHFLSGTKEHQNGILLTKKKKH